MGKKFECPDNHWGPCKHCGGYVPLCQECIDDWPMGRQSYCCTEAHIDACSINQLHPTWKATVVYPPKNNKKKK